MIRGLDLKLKILEAVCASDTPLTIYSLSKKLGKPPSVIRHHVFELEAFGILHVEKVTKGDLSKRKVSLNSVFACKDGLCFLVTPLGFLVFMCPFLETCSRKRYIHNSAIESDYCRLMKTKIEDLDFMREFLKKIKEA